jgi:SAM-dependent methyltransferase
MYREFADLWTEISHPDDYAEEAVHWLDTLSDLLGEKPPVAGRTRHTLLELGVGGGNNLSHLTAQYDAVAVDLSPEMLANSEAINPGVEHIVDDMRTLRLDRRFDAVLAHDAISYMTTEADLRRVFDAAAAHLEPGGVFITSPDWFRGVDEFPNLTSKTVRPGESLSYVEYAYDPDPSDTEIDVLFVYLIHQPDGTVTVEEDLHKHGLFPLGTWLELIHEAGFDPGVRAFRIDEHEEDRLWQLVTGVLR